VAKLERWMAKLVARLLATSALCMSFESRHRSKIQNGQHEQGSVQHTLIRKIIYKQKMSSGHSDAEKETQTVKLLKSSCHLYKLLCTVYCMDRN
jgi:hypothetical protein